MCSSYAFLILLIFRCIYDRQYLDVGEMGVLNDSAGVQVLNDSAGVQVLNDSAGVGVLNDSAGVALVSPQT